MCSLSNQLMSFKHLIQALVDGPCTNVRRQAIGFNRLSLTDFKIRISHSAREKQVRKAYEKENINVKWEQTSWARRISSKVKRQQLTDFDRFKLKVLRQQVRIVALTPPLIHTPHPFRNSAS